MTTPGIKICGLKDEAAVAATVAAGAQFAGFVHFPASPRHVALKEAANLAKALPKSVASVCVLVDPDDALLDRVRQELAPRYLQLHGNETPERIAAIRAQFLDFNIIKAFRIRSADDVAVAHAYAEVAELFLFDARAPEAANMLPGGNGLAFDWALLQEREFARPWLLSGGLNSSNVKQALRMTGAKMLDVSSGVERAPGVKDAALINAFVEAARA